MLKLSRPNRLHAAALSGLCMAFALAAAPAVEATTTFDVSYNLEQPGVENANIESTQATFTTVGGVSAYGVETFNGLAPGMDSFRTDFGTGGLIEGQYTNVQINKADEYGGAGGSGQYPVAFSNTPYQLTLNTSVKGGVNYFGFWLSALDAGNYVTFYSGDKELFQFRPSDLINAIKDSPDASAYYGNPNPSFQGQDGGEPFAFVNFFDTKGSFNRVVFQEVNYGGGYESDNHTVGHFVGPETGAPVTLVDSLEPPVTSTVPPPVGIAGVPEPATWAMMTLGVSVLGAILRRRRARDRGAILA